MVQLVSLMAPWHAVDFNSPMGHVCAQQKYYGKDSVDCSLPKIVRILEDALHPHHLMPFLLLGIFSFQPISKAI